MYIHCLGMEISAILGTNFFYADKEYRLTYGMNMHSPKIFNMYTYTYIYSFSLYLIILESLSPRLIDSNQETLKYVT